MRDEGWITAVLYLGAIAVALTLGAFGLLVFAWVSIAASFAAAGPALGRAIEAALYQQLVVMLATLLVVMVVLMLARIAVCFGVWGLSIGAAGVWLLLETLKELLGSAP